MRYTCRVRAMGALKENYCIVYIGRDKIIHPLLFYLPMMILFGKSFIGMNENGQILPGYLYYAEFLEMEITLIFITKL